MLIATSNHRYVSIGQFHHSSPWSASNIQYKNVLIQEYPIDGDPHIWWVKLTDFGISKPLGPATSGASAIVGTLLYMAPEQLGWGSSVDINYLAVDMWALGVMSYRMLMGVDLFPTIAKMSQYWDRPELSDIDDRKTSTDGATFIRALLRPQAPLRLESAAALVHDWIRPSRPSAQALEVPDVHSE